MKKLFKLISSVGLGVILMLSFCVYCMFGVFGDGGLNEVASAAKISEEQLSNVTDLIETDEEKLKTQFGENFLTAAPYNSITDEFMNGKAINPVHDKFNQTPNATFSFGSNSDILKEEESLFLWLYIPDEPNLTIYNLSFTLHFAGGGNVVWLFDVNKLSSMCDAFPATMTISYGWKLFELKPSDSISSNIELSALTENPIIALSVSYVDAASRGENITNYPSKSIAVYHIFKAISYGNASGIISSLNFSAYRVKQSFSNSLNNVYAGDSKVICSSMSDIFEFVYVGKDDLSKAIAENFGYSWQLGVNFNGTSTEYSFGQEYEFSREGDYTFQISLKEYASTPSLILYSEPITVSKFTLGTFTLPDYTVDSGETKQIVFNFSQGFNFDSDLTVYCSDNSVAEVTYYKESDRVKINVKGLKKGKVNISVEARGHRDGKEQENYKSGVVVRVNGEVTSNFTKIVLWSALAIFGAALLTFMVISVVKARKNSVK